MLTGFRYWRINRGDGYVDKVHNHIDSIENFWNQAKRQLCRYNGIPKDYFPLFIKEAEFRFNYGLPSASCASCAVGPSSPPSNRYGTAPRDNQVDLFHLSDDIFRSRTDNSKSLRYFCRYIHGVLSSKTDGIKAAFIILLC